MTSKQDKSAPGQVNNERSKPWTFNSIGGAERWSLNFVLEFHLHSSILLNKTSIRNFSILGAFYRGRHKHESAFILNRTQRCATSRFGIIHFQPSAFGITEKRKCELNYGEFHLDWWNQNVRGIWFRRRWRKCFKAIWKHIDERSCWINSHFQEERRSNEC